MSVGVPESLVFLVVVVFWLLPIVAGSWALVTLHRLRTTQDEMSGRLAQIERLVAGKSA